MDEDGRRRGPDEERDAHDRGRPQYCGGRNIALESYTFGRRKAQFYIRNLPDLAFRAARRPTDAGYGGDHWHTFAGEVTPNHISWFVDARVVATERRPEAISGVPLTVKVTLKADGLAALLDAGQAQRQVDQRSCTAARHPPEGLPLLLTPSRTSGPVRTWWRSLDFVG